MNNGFRKIFRSFPKEIEKVMKSHKRLKMFSKNVPGADSYKNYRQSGRVQAFLFQFLSLHMKNQRFLPLIFLDLCNGPKWFCSFSLARNLPHDSHCSDIDSLFRIKTVNLFWCMWWKMLITWARYIVSVTSIENLITWVYVSSTQFSRHLKFFFKTKHFKANLIWVNSSTKQTFFKR